MSSDNNATYDCDVNDPECYSPTTVDPWETDFAVLVPRFTGGLSAISSALIIYVILKSETRLSSIYQRIMFGMSLADICSSISVVLTSLPMPSYMPKEEVFGYHWTGTRLGNTATCNAQGFFATLGGVCMMSYNGMLCVYYACAIAFSIRERQIKKYVEPLLHGFPVLAGLASSLVPLFYDMYNPGITAYAWCGPFPYPDECAVLDGVECVRGNTRIRNIIHSSLPPLLIFVLMTILLPLGLVIRKVKQIDRALHKMTECSHDHDRWNLKQVVQKQHNTKAVIVQAFSYIAAFLIGFVPPLILISGIIDIGEKRGKAAIVILFKIFLVFFPLGGFFNFIIFISHKVYNYRRIHRNFSICHVLGLLFRTSAHDPCFISRISIIQQNEENDGDVGECCEVEVHDESNEELNFRLRLMSPRAILEDKKRDQDEIAEGQYVQNWEYGSDDEGGDEDDEGVGRDANDRIGLLPPISHNHVASEEVQAVNPAADDDSSIFSHSLLLSQGISVLQPHLSLVGDDDDSSEEDGEKLYYKDYKH